MTVASTVVEGHDIHTLPSENHVVVRTTGPRADSITIADSRSGHVLIETGMPDRWYLPRADVLVELLPSDTTSHCPFKGDATYFNALLPDGTLLADVAWSYGDPRSAVLAVAGELSFWTDAIVVEVDGAREPS
jgi:uncharacterized protein (DUF427 family)